MLGEVINVETMKAYYNRSGKQGDAHALCQIVVGTAKTGEELRDAAILIVGTAMTDSGFESMLRDRVFDRIKELVKTSDEKTAFGEARALGEALTILSGGG